MGIQTTAAKSKQKPTATTREYIPEERRGLTGALRVNRTRKCEDFWIYLCCGGGRLQQPLLLPQAAGHNAGDFHGLLQVLALEMLLDSAQVVLIENIVLLQEAAVLLVYFPQEVVEHQCGVRLFVGGVSPCRKKDQFKIVVTIWSYFKVLKPKKDKRKKGLCQCSLTPNTRENTVGLHN